MTLQAGVLKAQVGAAAHSESPKLLKTIRALTRPRGFESHALRLISENRRVRRPVLHRSITGNFSTAYSASKWALGGLSRSAAYVYADWGIRCNVIQPGFIETEVTAQINSNPVMRTMNKHTMSNTILLRRTGKAEEIATTVLFLASDDSSYITGTDIVVDGGWFSSAPYLGNERSHHMLTVLKKKEQMQEFLHHFH